MLIAIDKEYAGIVAVADTVKDTSKSSYRKTEKNGSRRCDDYRR